MAHKAHNVSVLHIDASLGAATNLNLSTEADAPKFLLLAEPNFAARGIDVRSLRIKTSLIIATRFKNVTQYDQAMKRVGR